MSVLLELPLGEKNLDRERSRSTECLDESYSARDTTLTTRAQSTQDLSKASRSSKIGSAKMDKQHGQDVLLSRTGTTRRKDLPFSVKFAVSSTRPPLEYCALDAKSPTGGKSKPTADQLDQMLVQVKTALSSMQSERLEMEAELACMIEEVRLVQIRVNQNLARRLSLPEDRGIIRAKSVSRSPNRYSFTLRRASGDSLDDETDGIVDLGGVEITPECQLQNPSLTRGKSMRQRREASPEGRSFFGSSLYRSLRVKKEDANSSPGFQRGAPRAMSMRQKISSIVKSPSNFIKHATSSSQKNSPAASSKSNVSLSPSILRPNASIMRQSRRLSHRNSLPESVLISTIPEDGMELNSDSPSHQYHHYKLHHKHFDSLEEKSITNTMTVRRSSLTGQLEQCYKGSEKMVVNEGEGTADRRHSDSGVNFKTKRSASDTVSMYSSISAPRSPEKGSPKASQGTCILTGTETTV